jgi:hypothetical protein
VKRGRKRLSDITSFAEEFVDAGESVFIATTKPIRMVITGETEPEGKKLPANYHDRRGFDISHNGKIKGRNFWAKHTVAFIVGREEMPAQDAEELARAIYANANLPVLPAARVHWNVCAGTATALSRKR